MVCLSKIIKLDMNEIASNFEDELKKFGMTRDDLLSCVRWCGCCVELPSEFYYLSEDAVKDLWDRYRFFGLERYYES